MPLNEFRRLVKVSYNIIVTNGPQAFFEKALQKFRDRVFPYTYADWLNDNGQDPTAVLRSLEMFHYRPVISILMPVYETDEKFLKSAIQSVTDQLYGSWELCICDDGSRQPHVKRALEEASQKDHRIKITGLSSNRGIASASNEGMKLATGEFIGFLDHDDVLYPDALYEVVKLLNQKPTLDFIYSDEDKIDELGKRVEPFFKPDWSPDLLLSMNYVTHFAIYRSSFLHSLGGLKDGYQGSQDYDLALRVTENTKEIGHVRRPIYGWRKSPTSTALSISARPMALDSAVRALRDAMERRGIDAEVRLLPISCYRISYKVEGRPLISIIIPIGSLKFVKDCVTSLIEKTNYNNCEIIILDNRTRADISKILPDDERLRIIPYDFEYNFSRMNNFASKVARGEYLLFLNDDTKVISAEWLSVMLEHAQREEVGAVGAKLLYANGTVQHAGIIIGVYGYAVNYGPGLNLESSDPGSFGLAAVIRNCSAVTAACMMVRKSVFTELGGFDETLGHSWNDVDFGIRILESGRRIVYTPYAELYHYEGGTRGQFDVSVNEIAARERFKKKHLDFISRGDPYYNPNLSLVHPYQISRANKRR